jgi:hypothetical protein
MTTPRRDRRSDDPQPGRARQDERRKSAPLDDAAARLSEDSIDMAIEMTFPASDPPAWTAE